MLGKVQYILVASARSSCSLCATPLTWPHPVWETQETGRGI